MADYLSDEHTYGEAWAEEYDTIHREVDHDMIDLLETLAEGDPPRALELAVGTGRVAIPLAQRGVAVTGVDLSESMLARMAGKDGGDEVEPILGDMASVSIESTFPLVYVVFNSLFGLSTQDRQVECYRNVAKLLQPGGRFLVECFVPDLSRFDRQNTRMSVTEIGEGLDHAYDLSIHDPVTQSVTSHHVRRRDDGETKVLPVKIRYAWPAELDLMARLAQLELEGRWAWYDRSKFDEMSKTHVSVYKKG